MVTLQTLFSDAAEIKFQVQRSPNNGFERTLNRRVVLHLMNIQVGPAATTDGPSIEALYSEWGYKSGFSQNDQIFLAQKGEQIVGVVKPTFESNVFVLRGMFIKTELQGKEIGSKLLGPVNEWLGNKQAFCVSFKHLSNFYGQIGFAEISDSEAPDFLLERKQKYLAERHNVILMQRVHTDV